MTRPTTLDRFWAKVEKVDGCWRWLGPIDQKGYARFKVNNVSTRAHRWAYETFAGPIPSGLQLDHLCHTQNLEACMASGACLHRRCVNPDHLEPVTALENRLRGGLALSRPTGRSGPMRAREPRTHCMRGHEYTPETTVIDRGARHCRICKNAYQREYYQAHKAS